MTEPNRSLGSTSEVLLLTVLAVVRPSQAE
jgi:hypothetical protein